MVSILVFAVRNISCVSCLLSIRVRAFVLVSLANTFYLFICRVCNWTTAFDTGLELSRVLYEGFFSRSSSGSVLWLSFSVIAKRGQSAANNTRQISFSCTVICGRSELWTRGRLWIVHVVVYSIKLIGWYVPVVSNRVWFEVARVDGQRILRERFFIHSFF